MFQILLRERLPVIPGQLFLHNTQFGYIVAGTAPSNSEGCSSQPSNFCNSISEAASIESLNRNINRFWECEKVPEKFIEANTEQELAEQIFNDTVVLENERFEVSLPLKQNYEDINLATCNVSCIVYRDTATRDTRHGDICALRDLLHRVTRLMLLIRSTAITRDMLGSPGTMHVPVVHLPPRASPCLTPPSPAARAALGSTRRPHFSPAARLCTQMLPDVNFASN
ncbi:unnamed protein product [Plutella xylostella]|uniref:(diamondback moth) hypothetical protein n=1 Tax=Plutella xylostella TaxID=51655 RepID=A0A8S4G1G5_PLUXY|nr:unnamed protein product [Plutella xylostella]